MIGQKINKYTSKSITDKMEQAQAQNFNSAELKNNIKAITTVFDLFTQSLDTSSSLETVRNQFKSTLSFAV
jgi:hypothetical protein